MKLSNNGENANGPNIWISEQFCEYLLPYKCFEGQPLTEWRNAYYDICKGDIDLAYLCDEYKRNPIFCSNRSE